MNSAQAAFAACMRAARASLARPPDMCVVCRDDMTTGDKTRALSCGHVFHETCVNTWLRRARQCPLCRRSVGGGCLSLRTCILVCLSLFAFLAWMSTVSPRANGDYRTWDEVCDSPVSLPLPVYDWRAMVGGTGCIVFRAYYHSTKSGFLLMVDCCLACLFVLSILWLNAALILVHIFDTAMCSLANQCVLVHS